MLLKNGKNVFVLHNATSSYAKVKDYMGSVQDEYMANSAYAYIAVGSNDTAPTTSDYSINEISGLSRIANTGGFSDGTDWNADYYASFSTTYKNVTSNDITIKEFALCFYDTYRDNFWHYYLTRDLCKDVYGEDVVIHPGEAFTFSITIG